MPGNVGRGQSGFTLLELMVALVISSIMLVSIFNFFTSSQETYIVQDEVTDSQQSIRVSATLLKREMRLAGYGTPTGTIDIQVQDNNPDSITIVGCVRNATAILSAAAKQGGGTITLTDAGGFSVGDNIFIGGVENAVITGITGNVLTIDTDSATAGNQNLQNSYMTNASMNLIRTVTYAIDSVTDSVHPRLTRAENGGTAQLFAENIEDMQIRNGDGTTPALPGQSSYILTLTARTDREDDDYTDQTFNDGYRRKTVVSNIKIRNLSIQNQGF